VTEQDQTDLWRLRTKWVGVYAVALAEGTWRARRYGDTAPWLIAATAEGLGHQIEADYAAMTATGPQS
jgi:hypothetical protein